MDNIKPNKWITRKEAAKLAGKSPQTIQSWYEKRYIVGCRFPIIGIYAWYFDPDSILEYMKKRELEKRAK